jgi:IS30 family transposase
VHVTAATIALLSPFKKLVLSITADNGKEFAYHERIAQSLGCKVYFAHPYSSWERGLNENANGLARQYFPKRTNFNDVSDRAISKAIRMLNNRPRKLLAFKTPAYLMWEQMAALAA